MNPPKENMKSWKWPRLYWSETALFEFIIIYPDGKSQRSTSCYPHRPIWGYWFEKLVACWDQERRTRNPFEARKLMMKYAKDYGFQRIFVGEIK